MSDETTNDAAAEDIMTPEEVAELEAERATFTPEELAALEGDDIVDPGPMPTQLPLRAPAPKLAAVLPLDSAAIAANRAANAWKKDLKVEWTKAGRVILPSGRNLLVILDGDPRLKGCLAYDELRECVVKVRDIEWSEFETIQPSDSPWSDEWTDVDDTRLVSWLDGAHDVKFSTQAVHSAVNAIAMKHKVNPIRDYLRGLVWDATPRLNRWLHTHLGAADTKYETEIGSRWMISAVARALQPGCKADHVLVLEGNQGDGKSTALQILASLPWFSDDDLPIGNKDAAEALHGTWIHELGEIGKLNARALDQVKAFVVRRVDKYRASYGHRSQSHARRCVFAGSSNDRQYLTDPTGGRRWWGVRCGVVGPIDLDAIRRDRDQMWAEAVVRYDQGEAWHVDSAELASLCTEQQESRLALDPWTERLASWLESMTARDKVRTAGYLTTNEVLALAFDINPDKMDVAASMRIGAAMRRLGWERRRYSLERGRVWGYTPPETLAL